MKHKIFKYHGPFLKVVSLTLFVFSTFLLAGTPTASSAHSAECSDVFTPLSTFVVTGVNNNKNFYLQVMNETGVPWEMLAAIHYRETNFSHTNPSNGQGIFQFVNGGGGPYPAGPVSDEEFVRQLRYMATRVQEDYVSRGSVPRERRRLVPNEQNIAIVKDTLFSYNGRAQAYVDQAVHFGFNASTQPYEGSPYVMNRFDCQRARMGIITRDYATGVDGIDTRYGAFTIFARLRGDDYRNSLLQPYSTQLHSSRVYTNAERTQEYTARTTITPGSKAYVRLKVVNTGYQTWEKSFMRLGTSSPRESSSQIYDSSWLAANRPAQLTEDSVAPGAVGTFDFAITGPRTGTFVGKFNLVAESRAWLNDIGISYGINIVAPAQPNTSFKSTLDANEKLTPGQKLMSQDGQSVLILQTDGNLVLRRNFIPVWSTNTAGSNPDRLIMQPDGNLVLYNKANSPVWYSGTGSGGSPYLTLQTDSNMVIYAGNYTALWSSGTMSVPNLLNYTESSIPNGIMYPNQTLSSADRGKRVVLQPDGNLVLYHGNRAVWSSGTYGHNIDGLVMQADGNLVLYSTSGQPIWSTKTFGNGVSYLEIQDDGNLVIYNYLGKPTWWSGT